MQKEGAHGGTMGSPVTNEWGYSCRLVDVVAKIAADIPATVSA